MTLRAGCRPAFGPAGASPLRLGAVALCLAALLAFLAVPTALASPPVPQAGVPAGSVVQAQVVEQARAGGDRAQRAADALDQVVEPAAATGTTEDPGEEPQAVGTTSAPPTAATDAAADQGDANSSTPGTPSEAPAGGDSGDQSATGTAAAPITTAAPTGGPATESSATGPPPQALADAGENADEQEGGDQRARAGNQSIVFQVIWQIQEGCRHYCHGTSQSQSAEQWAHTRQEALAEAGQGAPASEGSTTGHDPSAGADHADAGAATSSSSATASNEAVTIQFVWQLQLGCVAFCFETSQSQHASQGALTEQQAYAAAAEALAENFSQTTQFVWQEQRGCREECYGTTQSQSLDQTQTTTQVATAEGGAGPGPTVLAGWLVALADNIGATIQTIFQHQRAECLEHCSDEAQEQRASQQAELAQTAAARAQVAAEPDPEPGPRPEPQPEPQPAPPPGRAAPPTPPSATASQMRPAVLRAPAGKLVERGGRSRRGRLRLVIAGGASGPPTAAFGDGPHAATAEDAAAPSRGQAPIVSRRVALTGAKASADVDPSQAKSADDREAGPPLAAGGQRDGASPAIPAAVLAALAALALAARRRSLGPRVG